MRLKWRLDKRPPEWLGMSVLEELQKHYPPRTGYRYDPESILKRASGRAQSILALPGAAEADSFLELACSDGMVCAMLQRAGKNALATDLDPGGFDPRAAEAGVTLLAMDATDLQLASASFDYVLSYNSFEHFAQPELVLSEIARVLKPGGYAYLNFGPLYYSPWGEHAYRTITVPYCQFLFPKELMNEYARQRGFDPIQSDHVNGWSLERYRGLWRRFADDFETVHYEEMRDHSCLNIIRRYPSCFRGRAKSFDNFLVTRISALFRRKRTFEEAVSRRAWREGV